MAETKRYYRKDAELFLLVNQIKLWLSRGGILHGVKEVVLNGNQIIITTFCGETFQVYNSRSSRAARWLRNKWVVKPCQKCKVPEWKIEKYSKTMFQQHYGSDLHHKK